MHHGRRWSACLVFAWDPQCSCVRVDPIGLWPGKAYQSVAQPSKSQKEGIGPGSPMMEMTFCLP